MNISIIIPLYNKRYTIFSTIDSVLNQSYTDFELIVIDDGSTDGSAEMVKNINDERLVYVRQENAGVSSARNRGIREAKGEWILFLDADDYLIEDGLEHFMDAVKKYPQYKVYTDNSRKQFHGQRNEELFYNENRLWAYARELIIIRTGNTLFHKDCFETCGLFDERLSLFEDYGLFAEIVRRYPITQIGEKVFAYETDFCGLSGQNGLSAKDYLYHLRLTGDDAFDQCLYNFLGMRLNWAQADGNIEVVDYIRKHFNAEKALAVNAEAERYAKNIQQKKNRIVVYEILYALLRGHVEMNRSCLLSLCPSRYGKYGSRTKIGAHAEIKKASKVFLYDNVEIGSGLQVDNKRGKLIVRCGTRIGKNLHVCTYDDKNNMNVVIGKNVMIGDNVTLHAGTYIHDGETVPSNTTM